MNRELLNRTDYFRPRRQLEPRELEAVMLLGQCLPVKAIAQRMRIGPDSVKSYLHEAYKVLGFDLLPEASVRLLAARWAMARGLDLPISFALDPRQRLLEDLGLSPDWPANGQHGQRHSTVQAVTAGLR